MLVPIGTYVWVYAFCMVFEIAMVVTLSIVAESCQDAVSKTFYPHI